MLERTPRIHPLKSQTRSAYSHTQLFQVWSLNLEFPASWASFKAHSSNLFLTFSPLAGSFIHRLFPTSFPPLLLSFSLHSEPLLVIASEDEERLVRDLFRDYNKLIRPVEINNNTVEVLFSMSLIQLINVVRISFFTCFRLLSFTFVYFHLLSFAFV